MKLLTNGAQLLSYELFILPLCRHVYPGEIYYICPVRVALSLSIGSRKDLDKILAAILFVHLRAKKSYAILSAF